MATPIGKSIGKGFSAIGKLGNFLWNNPLSKALKFCTSLALGPSLFVFGGALSLIGRGALEVGQVAHTKLIRTFDNTTLKKVQAGWQERLESYKSFVTSSLESSMSAWYDTADFVRDSWASRQDDAGYGNSNDSDIEDPTNVENSATVGGEKKFKDLEVTRVTHRDTAVLGEATPSLVEATPSGEATPPLGEATPSVTIQPTNKDQLSSAQQGRGRAGSSGSLRYTRRP